MEQTTLIDADGDELIFAYSWTGHLQVVRKPHTGLFIFSPEEVEKLRKLLNSFDDGNKRND